MRGRNYFLYSPARPVLTSAAMADLTTKEVAERYHVQDAAVRQWCRRGLFQNAYQEQTPFGALWRIPERDLKKFAPTKKTGRPPKPREEENAA